MPLDFDFDFGYRDYARDLARIASRRRQRLRLPAPTAAPRAPQPGADPNVSYRVIYAAAQGPVRDMPWARDLFPAGAGAITIVKPAPKRITYDRHVPTIDYEPTKAGGPRRSATGPAKHGGSPAKKPKLYDKYGNLIRVALYALPFASVPLAVMDSGEEPGALPGGGEPETQAERAARIRKEILEADEIRRRMARQEAESKAEIAKKEAETRAIEAEQQRRDAAEKREKDKDEAAKAAAASSAPAAKPFWRQIFDVGLNYKLEQLKQKALQPRYNISTNFAGPIPEDGVEPIAESQTLTSFYSVGVPSSSAEGCECPPKKKKKPKKPRDVCYSGTYVERADGLSKTKKRKVPCRPSSAKKRS